VAERQTRTVQVRVLARVWGFKSPLAHDRTNKKAVGTSHLGRSFDVPTEFLTILLQV
jgi:hypothetical protein